MLKLSVPVPVLKAKVWALPSVPVVPAVLPVTVKAPLFVLKVGVAALAVVKLPPIVKVSPLVKVLMLLARLTAPLVPEVWKLPPVTLIGAADPKVKRPELVTLKPPAVVVKPSSTLKVEPFKLALPTFAAPTKVLAPVAVSVSAPVMPIAPLKLVVPALVMLTAVKPVASGEVPEP